MHFDLIKIYYYFLCGEYFKQIFIPSQIEYLLLILFLKGNCLFLRLSFSVSFSFLSFSVSWFFCGKGRWLKFFYTFFFLPFQFNFSCSNPFLWMCAHRATNFLARALHKTCWALRGANIRILPGSGRRHNCPDSKRCLIRQNKTLESC